MSQPFQAKDFNRNSWSPYPNRGYRYRASRGNGYYKNLSAYGHWYPDRRPWAYNRRKIKRLQRSPSPFSGTEEYITKQIQETSEMIKKKLLMPDENKDSQPPSVEEKEKIDSSQPVIEAPSDKIVKKRFTSNLKQSKYDKILNYISNLNHGRKVNLICSTSSGYDNAIEQIQKQRRLEITKALREMCSSQTVENCEATIHSVIPDFGLKIEDLPLEVIQQLSSTLDLDGDSFPLPISDKGTVDLNDAIFDPPMLDNIKSEVNNESVDFLSEIAHGEISYDELDKRLTTDNENLNDQIFIPQEIKLEVTDDSFTPSSSDKSSTTQTDPILQIDSGTQANNFETQIKEIEDLKDAVDVMLQIDKEIQRLTKLRQSVFLRLQKRENESPKKQFFSNSNGPKRKTNNKSRKHKKAKKPLFYKYEKPLEFGDVNEKVLIMQVHEETILAGCESGSLLFINSETGSIDNLKVTNVSITCLATWTNSQKEHQIYVGAFDATVYNYSYFSRKLQHSLLVGENIQCVEVAWNLIFVGTNGGTLKRYNTKENVLEFEEKISDYSIFVLKATQEGARRVLLIGSRNVPVTVRDAMSGLHLRTMTDFISPTVYCLILENSMVYCGTANNDLLVFRFHDGSLIRKHQATFAKGISCMKIVQNLLYASCHNGNIYVYDATSQTYVGAIEGPGGVILSMEIIENMVVVGTMSLKFQSILIPEDILQWKRSDI